MPLKLFFIEQFMRLNEFLASPREVLRCVRLDPELKDLFLKALVKMDADPTVPHVFTAGDLAFDQRDQYFTGLHSRLRSAYDEVSADLADCGMAPLVEAIRTDPPNPLERLATFASALADGLPPSSGSLVAVLDPESVADRAECAGALNDLAAAVASSRCKFLVLDERSDPLPIAVDDADGRMGVQDFYLAPEEMERQARADLARPLLLDQQERRQYLGLLAGFAFGRKDYQEAATLQQQWAELAALEGSPAEQASALHNLGNSRLGLGDPLGAEDAFSNAAELCLDHQVDELLPVVLTNLGITLYQSGQAADAVRSLNITRTTFQAQNQPPGEAHALDTLAGIYAEAGLKEQAEQTWQEAIGCYQGISSDAFRDTRSAGIQDLERKIERLRDPGIKTAAATVSALAIRDLLQRRDRAWAAPAASVPPPAGGSGGSWPHSEGAAAARTQVGPAHPGAERDRAEGFEREGLDRPPREFNPPAHLQEHRPDRDRGERFDRDRGFNRGEGIDHDRGFDRGEGLERERDFPGRDRGDRAGGFDRDREWGRDRGEREEHGFGDREHDKRFDKERDLDRDARGDRERRFDRGEGLDRERDFARGDRGERGGGFDHDRERGMNRGERQERGPHGHGVRDGVRDHVRDHVRDPVRDRPHDRDHPDRNQRRQNLLDRAERHADRLTERRRRDRERGRERPDPWRQDHSDLLDRLRDLAADPAAGLERLRHELAGRGPGEGALAGQLASIRAQLDGLRRQLGDHPRPSGLLARIGVAFAVLVGIEQMLSTFLSMIPFPAFPALRITDLDVGLPHAHSHPPNLTPPNPVPVPLPSTGPIIPIPFISGASRTLINGMPAARCGDMGLGVWCGGYFPMYEVFLGSSSVWIEGARAARMAIDITKHCTFSTPKPSDPPMGPMVGFTTTASMNVMIGGVPMPSLLSLAFAAVLKALFSGLGKVVQRFRRGRVPDLPGAPPAPAAPGTAAGMRGVPSGYHPPQVTPRVYDILDSLPRIDVDGERLLIAGGRIDLPNGITAGELAALTNATGREFGVVVNGGRLQLVAGAADHVPVEAADNVIVHTHPDPHHSYGADISQGDVDRAAYDAAQHRWDHPRAVVDSEGNVHHYDHNGIVDQPALSPIQQNGRIDGLHTSPTGAPMFAAPPGIL